MDKAERQRQRERTRRMGELAYAVYRQWWRPLKNRQRRCEMAALLAEDEQERQAPLAPRAEQEALTRASP